MQLTLDTGNICRSPMGEAVLKDIAQKRGIDIEVDSCGTGGYHVGEEPDERYPRIYSTIIYHVLSSLKDSGSVSKGTYHQHLYYQPL